MKILLINPYWQKKSGSIWSAVSGCSMPGGLAIIAAVLEKAGITVKVLDATAMQMPPEEVRKFIEKERFDYFGITATTFIVLNALEIAALCKKAWPDSKVIFGGVHGTIFPEELLSRDCVDYVVRGEGEESIVELLKKGDPQNIGGISYKKGTQIVHNPDRQLIENLDAVPLPAYHLFPMKYYHPPLGGYKRTPAINMITSRGCPGRCTFCYKDMFGTHTRMRSPEGLIEEIQLLQKQYGIREINFYDDTFTVSKDRIKRFCALLAEKNIDITWSCMSRIDYVDAETLKLMKKAGCHQICYGIESGDETILRNIKKPLSIKRAVEAVRLTREAGITVRLSFMLGNPGETEESMDKTISYAIELDPDIALFNITTPYPGSEMFEWADKNNYLLTRDWNDYNLAKMVMALPTVKASAVEERYRLAYRKFYMRPSYLVRRTLRALNPQELLIYIKVFFRMLRVAFH